MPPNFDDMQGTVFAAATRANPAAPSIGLRATGFDSHWQNHGVVDHAGQPTAPGIQESTGGAAT